MVMVAGSTLDDQEELIHTGRIAAEVRWPDDEFSGAVDVDIRGAALC